MNKIGDFSRRTRQQNDNKKREKEINLKNLYDFFDGRKIILNGFESKIFLTRSKGSDILNTNKSKLKTLTLKQMLQRLPIALAEVKAGNNSRKFIK